MIIAQDLSGIYLPQPGPGLGAWEAEDSLISREIMLYPIHLKVRQSTDLTLKGIAILHPPIAVNANAVPCRFRSQLIHH